jgi:hypothetical protein
MASAPFCDFLSLGAGVTPAEGSVKPTAGFTLNKVISPSPLYARIDARVFPNNISATAVRSLSS